MKKYLLILTPLALLGGGCSKEEIPETTDGEGSVEFRTTTCSEVDSQTTRAQTSLPDNCKPSGNSFKLVVKGKEGTATAEYLAEYTTLSEYTAPFMPYGDDQLRRSAAGGQHGFLLPGSARLYDTRPQDDSKDHYRLAHELGNQPRMRRVVQEILFRSTIHRPDRSGQQFQFYPLLIGRRSHLRQAGEQTSAQRYGGEGAERRESGIPAATDRCHDGPHLAQNPNRRFAGGTGQHQHPTGRYADRSTPAGNRTQPRSITPYKIS